MPGLGLGMYCRMQQKLELSLEMKLALEQKLVMACKMIACLNDLNEENSNWQYEQIQLEKYLNLIEEKGISRLEDLLNILEIDLSSKKSLPLLPLTTEEEKKSVNLPELAAVIIQMIALWAKSFPDALEILRINQILITNHFSAIQVFGEFLTILKNIFEEKK